MPRFVAAVLLVGALSPGPTRADNYSIDAGHSSAVFKIGHLGISWIHGRFNQFEGTFTIDKGSSSFAITIKTESIDTAIKKRDDHLRSPDFFNVKQYPLITFKSTGVKPVDGGYDVVGDLSMHGVTKSINLSIMGGKTAQMKGTERIGFTAEGRVKRSDFGMDKMVGPVGDEVHITVSFEGVKK